jgi:hypothetical protein
MRGRGTNELHACSIFFFCIFLFFCFFCSAKCRLAKWCTRLFCIAIPAQATLVVSGAVPAWDQGIIDGEC